MEVSSLYLRPTVGCKRTGVSGKGKVSRRRDPLSLLTEEDTFLDGERYLLS